MNLDPSVFRPEAIDPETAAFNQQMADLFASQPPMHLQSPAEVRAARAQGRGFAGPIVYSPNARVREIPGPAGPITLRCFIPAKVDGVYLFIHGGGWVLGSADAQDPRMEELSNNCNLAVVSVEYRLAPEHPYPAGPDDCEAAALWLAQNAQAEFGTDRLLIGGASAGAHLALVAMVRLRDRLGRQPFAAADLLFGVYDVDGTPSVRNWGERVLVLSAPIMAWFGDHFAPAERRREPDVSPLYADVRDMPPALFTIGTMDPLLDDTLFMHSRWIGAGNEGELAVYPGGTHGFTAFPIALGAKARAHEEAFLKAH